MTDENDNTTKLIVLVAGLSTIIFFAYLVYKDRNKVILPQSLNMPQLNPAGLERIEQRLMQLETKLDNVSNNTKIHQIAQPQAQQVTQPQTQPQPERTIVSMGKPKQPVNAITRMRTVNTREMFDMR